MHVSVDAHGLPVRSLIREGTVADCTKASELINEISAEYLLADRAYDTDQFLQYVDKKGIQSVIPPQRNRKLKREYDKHLYKLRPKLLPSVTANLANKISNMKGF